jgi:hypothetical protein
MNGTFFLRSAVILLMIGGTGACAPHSGLHPGAGTTGTRNPPPDTLPGFAGITDTDSDIWPDPMERTEVRIEVLRRYLADHFASEGAWPASLAAVLPTGRDDPIVGYGVDAWKRAFRYVPADTDYELRSAGPDGRFETSDDIVTTRTKATRMPWPS